MMLHRHFENEKRDNMTRLEDVSPSNGDSDNKDPDDDQHLPVPEDETDQPENKPPRRGRPRKEG